MLLAGCANGGPQSSTMGGLGMSLAEWLLGCPFQASQPRVTSTSRCPNPNSRVSCEAAHEPQWPAESVASCLWDRTPGPDLHPPPAGSSDKLSEAFQGRPLGEAPLAELGPPNAI